ncbi:MAG: hypothetical protein ACLVG5_00760 [Clostridium sp.]
MDDPDRDRFVMSKGHSVEAYYAVLAAKGFFRRRSHRKFSKFGSPYIGHPNNKRRHRDEPGPSRPRTSGLRGNGTGRMDKDYRVYTVMRRRAAGLCLGGRCLQEFALTTSARS